MIKALFAVWAVGSFVFAAPAAAEPPPGGYASCAQAAKDGQANLREGEPGYSPDLDRDGDGVACESDS